MQLAQVTSRDCHVTAYLVKACLLQGDIARAEEVSHFVSVHGPVNCIPLIVSFAQVLEELQTSAAADSAILFGLQVQLLWI